MKDAFKYFNDVMDKLLDRSPVLRTYFQHPYSFTDYIEYYDVTVFFGATRGCLYTYDYDYVAKFDVEEDYLGGSCCEREVKAYNAAVRYGLDKCFTSATYLGTYQREVEAYSFEDMGDCCEECDEVFLRIAQERGLEMQNYVISIPLYGYEKASEADISFPKTEADREYLASSKSPLTQRDIEVAATFLEFYGKEMYEALTQFCIDYEINDLHNGNIGSVDGRPVIIDYSGYFMDM